MRAFVLIDVEKQSNIDEIVRRLRELPEVVEAHVVLGPHDVVTVVETGSLAMLGELLTQRVLPIPGVADTLTCLSVSD